MDFGNTDTLYEMAMFFGGMPLISITINANIVAIYAAIVSTLVLFIQALNYWNNRLNVVLDYKTGYKVQGSKDYNPNKTYMVLTIKNKGKRPVTIQNVGYIAKNKEDNHAIFTESLYGSRELSEGKSTKYLVDQEEINLDKIKYFVAYDQADREFKCKA